MISCLSREAVTEQLEMLLPGCRNLLPDTIATSARQAGSAVDFIPLAAWEGMTDEEILDAMLPCEWPADTEMVVVTDASFRNGSPFLLLREDVAEFPRWHSSMFNENVMSGDVIVLAPDRRMIVLFHHSGFYAQIEPT